MLRNLRNPQFLKNTFDETVNSIKSIFKNPIYIWLLLSMRTEYVVFCENVCHILNSVNQPRAPTG